MSKTKVHWLIPRTTRVLCGLVTHYVNAYKWSQVTCANCKKVKKKIKKVSDEQR